MLKRTKIKQLLASDSTIDEVLLKGWVKTKRDSKDFSFIEINDGSCLKNMQVIANNTLSNYNDIKKLNADRFMDVTQQKVFVMQEDLEIEILNIFLKYIHFKLSIKVCFFILSFSNTNRKKTIIYKRYNIS